MRHVKVRKRRVRDDVPTNGKNIRPFGIRDKVGYAMGDFGCNLSFALITQYMADFYTQYIGLSAGIWATIIIITKIWDGVNDPIMGILMDNKKISKKGKFKPWIQIGSIGLIIAAALIFLPIPNAPLGLKITVCIVSYLLWDMCYTIVNVPYGALNSAISGDSNERTALSTWRSIGGGLGGALCLLLPLVVYDKNNNLVGGRFVWIALVMGIMAYFAFQLCIHMTTERYEAKENNKEKNSFKKSLKGFLTNRPLIAMCLATFAMYVFFLSFMQTKQVIQVFFGDAKLLVTLTQIMAFLPIVVMIPFVGKLVKKFGKKACVTYPLILSIVASIVLLFIPMERYSKTSAILYIVFLMLIQLGGGMFQLVCWAMITDCIDYQQLKTGMRQEGSVYAIYSLFRKIAQGLAQSIPLLCLVSVGFEPKANPIGEQGVGVPEKMMRISIVLMLVGSIVMFLSLLLVYNLGKKEVKKIGEELGKVNTLDVNDAISNRNE